jgi:hypothetical protein
MKWVFILGIWICCKWKHLYWYCTEQSNCRQKFICNIRYLE